MEDVMSIQMGLRGYDASAPAPGFASTMKVGDVLLNSRGERGTITAIGDNSDGAVFVVATGEWTAVWLQREVMAHFSR
jgi:hypothetical protein